MTTSIAQDRRFVFQLAGITVVAAMWRYGHLFATRWNRPLMLNDSWYYSGQAKQLTQGRWFRELFEDLPGAEHGPLTPVVLAPLSWMEDYVPWQRLGTTTIGVVVVVLVGLLGRRVGGDRVGVVAAGIAAVSPNFWMNDGVVMSESLATMLTVLALLALIRVLEVDSLWMLVALGATIGLAALTRSELGLFLPLAWLVLARWAPEPRRLLRSMAVTGVSTALVLAPWVGFNLVRFERPVLLTTNDGTTLLGSYCDATFSGPHRAGWFIGCVVDDPSWEIREPSLRSAAQRTAGLRYARDNAAELPRLAVLRLARTFDLYALGDLEAQAVGEERPRWAVRVGIGMFWMLAPLALWGIRFVQPRLRWVLALPLVTTVVVSILFYGAHRFRTPLEPVIAVLAAMTIATFTNRWRSDDQLSEAGPEPVCEVVPGDR
jgi:4-amino-4-deoxy-L-arabinose transferase-like glycosyltransferase